MINDDDITNSEECRIADYDDEEEEEDEDEEGRGTHDLDLVESAMHHGGGGQAMMEPYKGSNQLNIKSPSRSSNTNQYP